LSLEQAQQDIAADWTKAYEQYVGPLPGIPPGATERSSAPMPATPVTPEASPDSAQGVPGNADGSCPANAPIKGSRAGIYHVPNSRQYAVTKAKQCFPTTPAAEAAGYRAPKGD